MGAPPDARLLYIAQAVMEQKSLLVYDEYEDAEGRKRRVNHPGWRRPPTRRKADALQERFAE